MEIEVLQGFVWINRGCLSGLGWCLWSDGRPFGGQHLTFMNDIHLKSNNCYTLDKNVVQTFSKGEKTNSEGSLSWLNTSQESCSSKHSFPLLILLVIPFSQKEVYGFGCPFNSLGWRCLTWACDGHLRVIDAGLNSWGRLSTVDIFNFSIIPPASLMTRVKNAR